jgi:hypothetical protein
MNLINKITQRKKYTLYFVIGIFLVNMLVIELYYESIKMAMDNNYLYIKNYPIKLNRSLK